MAEADTVPSDVFRAGVGDEVRVATTQYEWSSPMPVSDVDEHTFESPFGEDFRARRVTLDGSKGATYAFDAIEHEPAPEVVSVDAAAKARGQLMRFTLGPTPRSLAQDTISVVTEHVEDPYASHEDAHPDRSFLGQLPLGLNNGGGSYKQMHVHAGDACEVTRCGVQSDRLWKPDVDIGGWPPAHIEWCEHCLEDVGVGADTSESKEQTPRELIAESQLDARVALPDILEAVDEAETLLDIQRSLSLQRATAKSVLRDLGLLGYNASLPSGNELADRLAALRNGEVPPEYVGGESAISAAREAESETERPDGDDTWRQYQNRGETA